MQLFTWFRFAEKKGGTKITLQPIECFLTLIGPLEVLCFLKGCEERKTLFDQPGDELIQRGYLPRLLGLWMSAKFSFCKANVDVVVKRLGAKLAKKAQCWSCFWQGFSYAQVRYQIIVERSE